MVEVRAAIRSSTLSLGSLLMFLLMALLATVAVGVSGCGQASPADTGKTAKLYPLMIGGAYAYADQTGTIVIPRQFGEAYDFHEGLAFVAGSDAQPGPRGYIDTTGKMVLESDGASEFVEGLAVVATTSDATSLAFMDRTGKIVIPGPFYWVSTFKDGLAIASARFADPETGPALYGAIDRTGRWAVPCEYLQLRPFSEGLAAALTKDGTWGYVNTTGQMVIAPQFVNLHHSNEPDYGGYNSTADAGAGDFVDGLAPARSATGWGYIDHAGAWVIQPTFQAARGFAGGLAAVQTSGLWGFVDRGGALVIPARFTEVGDFGTGPAMAATGGLRGAIDTTGAWAVAPTYKEVRPFSEGLAAVQTVTKKWGFVDELGNLAIPAEYVHVGPFADGVATVRLGGNTDDLIDHTGRLLTRSPSS